MAWHTRLFFLLCAVKLLPFLFGETSAEWYKMSFTTLFIAVHLGILLLLIQTQNSGLGPESLHFS
jgi:ABC-type transport system involved in cytochrome c biogenesis permease component